jgi:hypothetical protein
MTRRESKPEIEVPKKATFALTDGERATGWIVRLSVVGIELESLHAPPVGAELVVRAELVTGEGELAMTGRVQWSTATRFGVQFGPLGVKETSAIVRSSRRTAA